MRIMMSTALPPVSLNFVVNFAATRRRRSASTKEPFDGHSVSYDTFSSSQLYYASFDDRILDVLSCPDPRPFCSQALSVKVASI